MTLFLKSVGLFSSPNQRLRYNLFCQSTWKSHVINDCQSCCWWYKRVWGQWKEYIWYPWNIAKQIVNLGKKEKFVGMSGPLFCDIPLNCIIICIINLPYIGNLPVIYSLFVPKCIFWDKSTKGTNIPLVLLPWQVVLYAALV